MPTEAGVRNQCRAHDLIDRSDETTARVWHGGHGQVTR
jgi:hypothetical protein